MQSWCAEYIVSCFSVTVMFSTDIYRHAASNLRETEKLFHTVLNMAATERYYERK